MRELCLEQFVDEIYEDSRTNEDSKYIFFLGAGCSKSSGIPLAKELAKIWYGELKKQEIKFKLFNKVNKITDDIDYAKLYFKIFEALFPSPLMQQKKIQKLTEGVIPALGYYILADLMQRVSFNTVVTTNFDNLIQDAIIFSSAEKRALVITHQDLARFIERNNTPLIVKVHGDAHMKPNNSKGTTQKIPKKLKCAIEDLFTNAKVICIGYGGNDKSIANLLEGCSRVDQVYWLNTTEPNDVAIKKWWSNLKNKTFIKEYDFDKIMQSIKRKFDIKKPDFQKLAKELDSSYQQNLSDEIEEIQEIQDKTYEDYISLGDSYYDKNKYREAIEEYLKAVLKDENKFYPNARLGYLYNALSDKENTDKYYKKALYLELNNPFINGNYANFLNNIRKEYDRAEIYYERALELEPNHANNNGNYASFLFTRGEKEEALVYLDKAIQLIGNNNSDLELELEFYRLAHIQSSYEDSKDKLDALLKQGYESPNWDFSQNIQRAREDKHKHIEVLKDYATKISGLSYEDIK